MTPKLIVDFRHPAHINFFKPSLYLLREEGWNIDIVVLDRGKVPRIAAEEFPGFKIYRIGRHRGTKLSIIFEANMLRLLKMGVFLAIHRYHIGISVSSFILGAAAKTIGMPNLQFYDDPEYKKHFKLQKLTSTKTYYPKIKDFSTDIETFTALKEWAYLSPRYFSPHEKVLQEYELKKQQYIFVREVINSSLNYEDQDANIISTFSDLFPEGFKVVLSLEDKKAQRLYPKDWIILKEPVSDIHSLIFYSKLAISSGDSMAREAAILGVPSIYCGIREMTANRVLIEKGRLFHVGVEDCVEHMSKLINNEFGLVDQQSFINRLSDDWEDVTEFIVKRVKEFAKF
ncbi:DUF354 domain-containing protein [uncultured Sunxiuqinia sp.]|uniref:DUF354 domain-containing protein n=1 Tax=uncultured Sunxiuqinia sp. TaxID=1573825 RepID=UPI002AA73494|nr:DUF354 domain-containing protein [uncultured Sunxiuqinia sp.]